jgi:hypothetical protein
MIMNLRRTLAAGAVAVAAFTAAPVAASAAVAAPASPAAAAHADYVISTCRGVWIWSQSELCIRVTAYGTRVLTVQVRFGTWDTGEWHGYWTITGDFPQIIWYQWFNGPWWGLRWYTFPVQQVNRTVPFNSDMCINVYRGTAGHHPTLLRQDCAVVL